MNMAEEMARQAEWLRRRREARAILEACGVDLTWISASEQVNVEALVEGMIKVVTRIERASHTRGYADGVAAVFELFGEGCRHDPAVVHDGIGAPRS